MVDGEAKTRDGGKNLENLWIAQKAPIAQISCSENSFPFNGAKTRPPNFSKFSLAVLGDSNGLSGKIWRSTFF
ncbi:MAG TPA: hypothetical protein VKS78_19900 [Roseiarcus sp.]|nr:hypothetical protein [Roseiarcus sp.]